MLRSRWIKKGGVGRLEPPYFFMTNFKNFYLTKKQRKELNSIDYDVIGIDLLTTMFEYSGECVDGVNTDYLDIILTNEGIVGMWLNNGRLMYGTPTVSGMMEANYTYEGTTGTVLNIFNPKISVQGTEGKDFVYMFNNKTQTPDLQRIKFADLFTQIDTSMRACLKKAIPSNMIGCANDKIKNAVNTALKSGDNGEPNTLVASTYDDEQLENVIHSFELSDTTLIEKLQFLSKFRDDTLSRVATLYGIALNSTGKMAQQNNIEMQGYNLFSRILPFNMLQTRRFAIDRFNKLFDADLRVEFSEPWKAAISVSENNIENVSHETEQTGGEKDENISNLN